MLSVMNKTVSVISNSVISSILVSSIGDAVVECGAIAGEEDLKN